MKEKVYKILIVDDEPDILEFVRYNLLKDNFEVFTASNGLDAIDIAQKTMPDLILLDIMMPGINGVEVCKQLRKLDKFKNTKIAFLTARDEDLLQIEALDSGGDDYISKPIRPQVLISRLKAILRRKISPEHILEHQPIVVGNIVIDREKYVVRKGDEQLVFARKEFEIIALLSSKPGKVFTRDEIFLKVWGPEIIVGNRTIDVHIRKIREKIGEDHLKTIKGVGYKFDF